MSAVEVPAVDHTLVSMLRGVVVEQLSAERRRRLDDGLDGLTREDERVLGRSMLSRALAAHRDRQARAGVVLPGVEEDAAVLDAAHAALFGLGRLQPLIDDPGLIEVNLHGCDQVWLTRDDGSKEMAPPVASSDDELVDWVRTMATYTGLSSRPWDPSNPWLEFPLPDGSRLVGLMSAVERPVVSIRLARRRDVSLDVLRELGDFDARLQAFLEGLVDARQNIIVSGATGAGKTTLVRALCARISPRERLVTVEHFLELGLHHYPAAHPEVVAMAERPPNSEGVGGLPLAELVRVSRRLNPGRLIVGECIGGEVVALLDGMTQGNDGGITTIHSRSARGVPQRIATYASREGLSMESALLLTAGAVDFIVHLDQRRDPGGRLVRFVSSVVEVVGFDGIQVVMSEVFATPAGQLRAVPAAAVSPERAALLAEHGWEVAWHAEDAPAWGAAGGGVL